MKKIIGLLTCLIFFPTVVLAAPSIVSISGITADNNSISIMGSEFGTKPQAAPLKWDDFDTSVAGQTWVEHDSYWSEGTNPPMIISNENPRIGNNTKAVLKANDPINEANMVWRDNVGFADTGKLYLNFWIRMDFGTALTAGYFQVKNVQVAVGSSQWGNGNMIMPMLSMNHFAYPGPPWYTQCLLGNYRSTLSVRGDIVSGSINIRNVDFKGNSIVNGMSVSGTGIPSGTTVTAFNSNTITISQNATESNTETYITIYAPSDPTIYFPNNTFNRFTPSWQNVAIQVDMGDPGIANGSKWYSVSVPDFTSPYVRVGANNRPILDAVANKLNAIKIGWYRSGYVDGAITSGTSTVQYDDLYIDNSWARVEIGDQSTYTSCTHREIQIPSVWSNDTISVILNQGSFPNDTTVYFFVVDSNGIASEGFPITLRGANTSYPAAPTNLKVE